MALHSLEIPADVPLEIIVGFARCHQLETWLREMVYLETKAQYGLRCWDECQAAMTRANTRGIPPERAQARDQQHPHMATAEKDPLWFLSFDALLKVLFDDQLWPLFEPYLTTKSLLAAKFEEIALIRNRVAHCRNLDHHDLDRLLLILRELDQGFFRFCASYGDNYQFAHDDRQDPVYQHFMGDRPWHERHRRTVLDLRYSLRPNTPYAEAIQTGKGRLYRYVIYTPYEYRQHFDYQEILRATRGFHENVAHIIMDSNQRFLYVTIPAVLPPDLVIATAECFYHVCANSHGRFLRNMALVPPQKEGEDEVSYDRRKLATINRIFANIALEWPHYVIPPDHAFALLDSSTPCTIFAA